MKYRVVKLIFLISMLAISYLVFDTKRLMITFPSVEMAAAGEAVVIDLPESVRTVEVVRPGIKSAQVDADGFAETGSLDICKPGMNLGRLVVLDELFDDSPMLDPGGTTLKDLIMLDRLFNNRCVFRGGNGFALNDLFVLDRLISSDGPLLDPDKTSLEDLIILDELFND